MTVQELIKALGEFDPEMKVVTGGFDESGYDDIAPLRKVKIFRKYEAGGHHGVYFDAEGEDGSFDALEVNF